MARIKLLLNSGAGDGHDEDDLIGQIKEEGHECKQISPDDLFAGNLEEDADFIVVGGGDGTVREITKKLLDQKLIDKTPPLALLPLGTANNIAKTLGLHGHTGDIIKTWKNANIKKYDVGVVYNISEAPFFLESFGFGVFSLLIKEMERVNQEELESPEEKLQKALELLTQLADKYVPRQCTLFVDGKEHSGKFILVEIMNIKSIGPNLFLAPGADPGDGQFEVVTVSDEEREKFSSYIRSKLSGKETTFSFNTIKAKSVRISWEGNHVHVDDTTVELPKSVEVSIEIRAGLLEFLVS